MRSMRDRKGFVDEEVREPCPRSRELPVVPFFAGEKTHVLRVDDSLTTRRNGFVKIMGIGYRRMSHGLVEQLRESARERLRAQGRHGTAARITQVRQEHYLARVPSDARDSVRGATNALVIDNRACRVEGHV